MSSLYSQINFTGDNINLAGAVDRVKLLPFPIMQAVVGLAMALEPELTHQEFQWGGKEARDCWNVKNRATVEAELKRMKLLLPINVLQVLQIAENAYVKRNLISPGDIWSWIESKPKAMTEILRNVLKVSNEEELKEVANNAWNWDSMTQQCQHAINRIIYGAMTYEACGTSEETSAVKVMALAEEQISRVMEESPDLMRVIKLPELRTVIRDVYNCFREIMYGQGARLSAISGAEFVVDKWLRDLLPDNVVLADHDKPRIVEILRGLGEWKI